MTDLKTIVAALFLSFLGCSPILSAQADGTFDPGFMQGAGFAGDVLAIARQPDGKLLIGGDQLSLYDGVAIPSLVRLEADGALDTGFDIGSGIDGTVRDLVVQADGRILVAGTFSTLDGAAHGRVVRLMPDGSVDATFNAGAGANDWVSSILLQPDGKIVLGGYFDTFNGTPVGHLVRLLPNGSIDATFLATPGANNEILAMALRLDGRIVFGGYFTTFHGAARNKLAQLNGDGSLDTTFDPGNGPGTSATLRALALAANGELYCGGEFFTWDGNTVNGAVRILTDGTRDPLFDASATSQTGLHDVVVQPDGNLLLAGVQGVERVTDTGADDPAFDTGTGFFGGLQVVVDIELLPDGRLLAGGQFTEYDGNAVGSIVRITGGDVGVAERTAAPWVMVGPNPSSGQVWVHPKRGAAPVSVTILDMLGKDVKRIPSANGDFQVHLPPAPGMYLLRLQSTENGTYTVLVERK